MLETLKTTTFNGTSKTTEGQIMVSMYCTIGETGIVSSNTNIVNKDLYEANKTEARVDMDAFTELCREEEDALALEKVGNDD